MSRRIFVFIAAGFLLMSAWQVRADVIVDDGAQIEAQNQQQAVEAPEGWKATHLYHILKGGVSPKQEAKPQYITGWGYSVSQIKDAYGFSSLSADGTGQTVGIVVACGSPTLNSDLSAFNTEFGLPSANLVYPNGQTSCSDTDWAFETSLDVEWVHALAPAAKIVLVVTSSDNMTDLLNGVSTAVSNGATVVAMSWGASEKSYEKQYDTVFQNSGVVYLAASGDSGSGTIYPSASKRVVSVGGTALYLNAGTGTLKWPEIGWQDSGGGPSKYIATPPYQKSYGVPNLSQRCTPDVAFDGDSYSGVMVYDSNYDPSTGNWWVAGGTSVSVQCWGAIFALANQIRANNNLGTLTDGHNALYALAGKKKTYNPNGYYRDITWGYNGNYASKNGYDFVTGLGSPVVNLLVPALAASTN